MAQLPLAAPVTRDQVRHIMVLHLMPTSQFQRTNNNNNNRLQLRRDQAQGLLFHRRLSTLRMSANSLITLPNQRRPHITTVHLPQHQVYNRSLTPTHQACRGVIPLLHPLRSVQASPSHSHQSGNSVQLSLQLSSVRPVIIAKTRSRWFLRPL